MLKVRSKLASDIPQHLGYMKNMVAGRSAYLLRSKCILLIFLVVLVASSLSMSTLSLSSLETDSLRVLRLSVLPSLASVFMHFDLISSILEFIFRISSLVGIFFFSCSIDEEKGFKDFLVTCESRIFAGEMRMLEGLAVAAWACRVDWWLHTLSISIREANKIIIWILHLPFFFVLHLIDLIKHRPMHISLKSMIHSGKILISIKRQKT